MTSRQNLLAGVAHSAIIFYWKYHVRQLDPFPFRDNSHYLRPLQPGEMKVVNGKMCYRYIACDIHGKRIYAFNTIEAALAQAEEEKIPLYLVN